MPTDDRAGSGRSEAAPEETPRATSAVTTGGADALAGGGELGALLRLHDWAATPLGPPEHWPQSLKTAVRIMLTSRQPIWIGWGPELTYLYNDAYKSIIGGKHPWAIGRPTEQVWHEIWGDIGPLLASAMSGDEGVYLEEQLLIMERNGYPEETYYTFSYSPIPDDDGTPGGIICANADDTQRVISERQLALLRELSAGTADARSAADAAVRSAAPLATDPHDLPFAVIYRAEGEGEDAAFTLAAASGIARGHPAAPERIADEDAGVWPLAAVAADTEPLLVTDLTTRFANLPRGVWQLPPGEAMLFPIHSTGQRAVLVIGLSPVRLLDSDYRGFLSLVAGQIASAVANAEAYEQERQRAEALAEIDRAKTIFFSNVSHEFRTPLTLMLGPLDEVRGHVGAGDRALLDVVHRNGLRLLRLVNTLLDFSRLEAGRVEARYERTDIAAVTIDLASNFRAACERAGLTLTVDCPPVAGDVYVDRDMWEKIVLNLISNAFKYTIVGGIALSLRAGNGVFELAVTDSGVGIPAAELPRLFDRFHRIEGQRGRTHEGSGIGLALVLELVRLHGGTVTAQSEEGRGSTFRVTLPIGHAHLDPDRIGVVGHAASMVGADAFVEEALRWLPAGDAIVPAVAEGAAVPSAGGDRILIADDNADMRDYIRRLVAELGHAVEVVEDGQAALEAARRDRPGLILTDVMMPRLDGFGLIAAVRADPGLRDVPVIMLSARAGEDARVEGIKAGADDYLTKPFPARELVARVSANIALAAARREAAAEIRAGELRLRNLFEQAPGFIAILSGPDHVFEFVNAAYRRLFGDRHFLGTGVVDAFPELAEQGLLDRLREVFTTGTRFSATGLQLHLLATADTPEKDVTLDFIYEPILDAAGAVTGIFVEGYDVSDRDRAEIALREESRTLEALNRSGASLAGELDVERVVQLVTDAGVEVTGAQFGAFFHNVMNEGSDVFALYTLSGVDRSAFDSFPMPRKTEVFAPTFRGEGVIRSDDILADARYGRNAPFHGMPPGHLPVRSYLAVPVLSRGGAVLGGLLFGHPEPGRFNDRHERLMIGIASQAAIAIDNARLYRAGQVEIIERRRIEAELRELNETLEGRVAEAVAEREAAADALRQAQKMEAVGQLTGGIAHDFNNLLTVITGNMDIVRRSLDNRDEPRARRAAENAQKGAERAASLTQRLLAFSRRQPLAPKPIDVDRLVIGMSDLLHRALGETVRLETVTTPGLWSVEADPNQLENCLLNLAVNARDAMPDGGRLTIETANARIDEGYSAAHAEVAPGSYVVIAVSDTGTGMSKETLAHVFEPFFTTKEVGRGTGLGLSMVYGFVKQSGGHVKIYSEAGQGTTVKIYLPRLLRETAGEEEGVEPVATGAHRNETILVAEDDDDVRAYTVEILRELGYHVLEAHDGPAALRLLARPDVTVDLLFTDVVMPEMSGRELTEQARVLRPDLRVLYTSGYTRNAIVHNGRLDPGVEMLPKPFSYQALSAKVRDVLEAGSSGRVLLAGIDTVDRALAIERLAISGHHVDHAATITEALGKLRASGGRYDLAIVSADLPDGRGIALVEEMRAMHSALPVLLAAAGGDDGPRTRFAADRHAIVLERPWTAERLDTALAALGIARQATG